MESKIKILVVEDEMLIGAKISMLLTELGYEVTGLFPRGEEALLHMKESKPDLVLLDIQLNGEWDGIETARRLHAENDIPIIFLTANADEATFNRAKITKPAAFISKPFKQIDLQRAIELAISRMADMKLGEHDTSPFLHESFILKDRIFIRHKDKMIKIMVDDILFIEADRNYSRIFTQNKEFLLSVTLKVIEDKFSKNNFVRIHRSYMVNITRIDEVAESHVVIGNKSIPLSSGLKEQLMVRIQTL
ncbi:MAG: DNA-binding response regulator [Niastella sp. SCN 39-18]|nr:response regulator [Sphingobacteriales bacterium]ODT53859.1 MAG: DNA-binding response regulator [Niastella sp. SCN 39-18]OJW07576.1 MAG: DNA-binding response regulator [Sphingobacteriales bacterium 39-19]